MLNFECRDLTYVGTRLSSFKKRLPVNAKAPAQQPGHVAIKFIHIFHSITFPTECGMEQLLQIFMFILWY